MTPSNETEPTPGAGTEAGTDAGNDSGTDVASARRPGWRGRLLLVALGVGLSVLLLAALELTLAVFDVGEDALYDDPFVGFAPGSDLFAETTLDDGTRVYETRPEKLAFFNSQRFLADKPGDGYRVFALGGSTTAGRPYDDRVAFPRWLELYLEEADPSHTWEVVNAGAISYASYRAALLMRELVRYEPDLFVIYTGHNEFLEERSYSEIIHQPEAVKKLRMWLSGFRFAALARRALGAGDAGPPGGEGEGGEAGTPGEVTTLAPEVTARLDSWDGLERYERDDELTRSVVVHFENNLRRMVRLARANGAEVVLVEPVSNVADFSPFKSQPGPGVDAETAARVAGLVEEGRRRLDAGDPAAAVDLLERAVAADDRYAEAWFRLGRALLAAGRPEDAYDALVRAKEEDVAPLRALEPVVAAVARVAADEGVALVPLRTELEEESRRLHGHAALGGEYLLDHVHPDVPVHARLAAAVLGWMADAGVVEPRPDWGEATRQAVYQREMAAFNRAYYGQRDLNLSKVLGWAGKLEEAEEPLLRAAEAIPEEPEVWLNLGIVRQRTGRYPESLAALDRAAELAPGWELVHFNRGVTLGHLGRNREGVAALRRALEIRPDYPEARRNLETLLDRSETANPAARGIELARAGRLGEAEAALERALAEMPDDAPGKAEAWYNLGLVRARLAGATGAAAGGSPEAAYRSALELAPDHPEANNNLGILLAGRGELPAALERFEAAAAAAPDWAEARFNLGVALDGLGRGDRALAEVRRAVELEPGNARFQLALGSLYAARGDAAAALRHLEAARRGGQPVPEEVLSRLRQAADG